MKSSITGFDKIKRDLEAMQRVILALDGVLVKITVTPGDPESVDRAIREMEDAIDEKTARSAAILSPRLSWKNRKRPSASAFASWVRNNADRELLIRMDYITKDEGPPPHPIRKLR
jgi:hypothetical protein